MSSRELSFQCRKCCFQLFSLLLRSAAIRYCTTTVPRLSSLDGVSYRTNCCSFTACLWQRNTHDGSLSSQVLHFFLVQTFEVCTGAAIPIFLNIKDWRFAQGSGVPLFAGNIVPCSSVPHNRRPHRETGNFQQNKVLATQHLNRREAQRRSLELRPRHTHKQMKKINSPWKTGNASWTFRRDFPLRPCSSVQGACLDFFFFFFQHEVSLREGICALLSWVVQFNSSRMAEEHAEVVRRLDLFADHADGLHARVEVEVVSSSICPESALLGGRCCRVTGCPDPE